MLQLSQKRIRNISNRKLTDATVEWNVEAWNSVGAAGAEERTSNLAEILNEIIHRSGWKMGNAVVFVISGSGKRAAESFNGTSSSAPKLYIEFQ